MIKNNSKIGGKMLLEILGLIVLIIVMTLILDALLKAAPNIGVIWGVIFFIISLTGIVWYMFEFIFSKISL